MTYTVPTVSDFRTRFPKFECDDNNVIQRALDEASRYVDDTWVSQSDFNEGRFLYAAHVLTLDGYGSSTEAELAQSGLMGFSTIKSGELTLVRDTSKDNTKSLIDQTTYGKRFKNLQKLNVGGPIAVVPDEYS